MLLNNNIKDIKYKIENDAMGTRKTLYLKIKIKNYNKPVSIYKIIDEKNKNKVIEEIKSFDFLSEKIKNELIHKINS